MQAIATVNTSPFPLVSWAASLAHFPTDGNGVADNTIFIPPPVSLGMATRLLAESRQLHHAANVDSFFESCLADQMLRARSGALSLLERIRQWRQPSSLRVTDNVTILLGGSRVGGVSVIRAHWMFLLGAAELLEDVANFMLRRDSDASKRVSQYIKAHCHWLSLARPRRVSLQAKGAVNDLGAILQELNRQFFDNQVKASITWGPQRPMGRHFVRLGSYKHDFNRISIRPCLDDKNVPRFFVESVVFHEMCHAMVPPVIQDGRRYLHTPAFWAMEARYPFRGEAKKWERAHLWRLLRSKSSDGMGKDNDR